MENKEATEEEVLSRVLFIRHGKGYHNEEIEGKQQVQRFDAELMEEGRQEARAVFQSPEFCAEFKPDVIYASPLTRTLTTALLALEGRPDKWSCPIIANELLREGNNRNACNWRRPVSTLRSKFPGVDFFRLDENGPQSGEEHRLVLKDEIEVVKARAQEFLEFLQQQIEKKEKPHSTVACFSHSGFIRILIGYVLGLGRHHSVKNLNTGGTTEILLVQHGNDIYWRLPKNAVVEVVPIEPRLNIK